MRVVRRPKGQPRRTLTAASQILDNPAQAFKSPVGAGAVNNGWQEIAWEMLDMVGELRFYVSWRSNTCGRVRLVASDIGDDGIPTGSTDNERVIEIVRGIAGGRIGQIQLVKRIVECLTVAGECWVAIVGGEVDDTDGWYALTVDEISRNPNGVTITLPDRTKHVLVNGTDRMFRIWNPRPRRAWEPDSPVRATLDSLHEIVRTTKTIANASKSRLIGNGIVFLPQEMSLPSTNAPLSANKPDGSVPEPTPQASSPVSQLQEMIAKVARVAYDDEDSLAALVPILVGVPGDQIKNVNHLKIGNDITQIALQTRNDAITRLALGLDVSPERLLGLGGTNHWSAWAVGDEDIQLHISPVMEMICQGIFNAVISELLEAEGIDSTKYILWYDTSQLTTDPDKTSEANDAFDRGTLNAQAYLNFQGLGVDAGYDLTKLAGWQQWAMDRVSQTPELLQDLMPLLPPFVQSIDFPTPAPALPAAPPPTDDDPITDDQEPPDEDTPSHSSDDDMPAAASAIAQVFIARALELAGKRRRSRADYDRLGKIPMHDTHRVLGPVTDQAKIPALIKGWDDTLTDDIVEMLGIDGAAFRAQVRRQVRAELTRSSELIDI
jgi:hypothetical protein